MWNSVGIKYEGKIKILRLFILERSFLKNKLSVIIKYYIAVPRLRYAGGAQKRFLCPVSWVNPL